MSRGKWVLAQFHFLCESQELSNRKVHKEGAKYAGNKTNFLCVLCAVLAFSAVKSKLSQYRVMKKTWSCLIH